MAAGDGTAMGETSPFQCVRCGTCCRWPGYVRVTAAEVERIAAHLGVPLEQFIAEQTMLTADRRGLSLREGADGACAFLTADNRCRLQAVKPRQCQEFPHGWNFPGWETRCHGA